jgi:MFS family permease
LLATFFFAGINLSIQQKSRLSVNGTNCNFYYLTEANLHMKKKFEPVNGTSIDTITIAVSICGDIVITIFSGSLLDWLGRLAVLVDSSLLLFFGGVLMLWSPNIYIALLARLIMGLGSGFIFTCFPIYIVETSAPIALYSLHSFFIITIDFLDYV